MPSLDEIIATLETAYPPELAEAWDAIGLVSGDRNATVNRILVCVDPTYETVSEAAEIGADLIVAHHPLLLRGVHSVSTDSTKGALIHRLIRADIALYCAHTNADAAQPGVSDALAHALGLHKLRPLAPRPTGETGIGRIGELATPEPLSDFVHRVAIALPTTVPGVYAAGEPTRLIKTVAVSGGSGDSYLDTAAAAGVDAYVTADLRHHPASEHMAVSGNPALVNVTHWASEWPWCDQAARVIAERFASTVDVTVSTLCTDPWTIRA